MSKPKFTKGPWSICWATYDGRRVQFEITAAPYGSIRPLAQTRWKTDWSEVEGEELEANGHLIAAAPELYEALKRARDMLQSVAGDIEDGGSLDSLRGKYVLAILGVRDAAYTALAKAEGR
jgi:hypothetical protein